MAEQRTFFVSVNLDDLSDEMDALDSTEERGLWLEGFKVGSRGHGDREGWHQAKARGYAFGHVCWEKAEEFRAKKAEAGQASAEKRRQKHGTAQPQRDRTDSEQCSGDVPNTARTEGRTDSELIHNPQSTIQETTNENQDPPKPPRGPKQSRDIPPTEEEWVTYCTTTWPDWHPICAAESWAYYQAKGWKIGNAPCRDWKAVARNAHGNARDWGKLQPNQGQRPAGPARSGPPAVRSSSDQAWVERNPNVTKPYTPPEGSNNAPAW